MKDSQTPTESLVKHRSRGTAAFLSITNTVADLLPDSVSQASPFIPVKHAGWSPWAANLYHIPLFSLPTL